MERLSSLTAEELNELVDGRNFPRPTSCSLNNSLDRAEDTEEVLQQKRKDSTVSENGHKTTAMTTAATATTNGVVKRENRPKPLDLHGIDAEKMLNWPGSSQTPRTSTTPG